MNNIPRTILRLAPILGAALLGSTPPIAHAADNASGSYLTVNGGSSIVPDVTGTASGVTATVNFSSGYTVGLTAGYPLYATDAYSLSGGGNWALNAELETAYIYNTFDSVSVLGVSFASGGHLRQIPVLANLVMTYNITDKWSAYCGLGGGISFIDLHVNSIGPIPVGFSNSETDGVIQAKIGLRYSLSDHSEVGIGYKYQNVLNTSYGTDVETHLFLLEFNWSF